MEMQKSSFASLAAVLILALCQTASADDWPQWLGPKRDGIWRETGILNRFSDSGPKVRWRASVGGGYSGPSVAGGRVFLTDRQLAVGASNPDDPFQRGQIPGSERVLCLNEADGKILWKHDYDAPYTISYAAGPRTTPCIDDNRVYTLGAEGHLFCFQSDTGKILWQRDLKKDYNVPTPQWGFSSHPLIDGNKLICLVGGPGSIVVAFDKLTGKELWKGLSAKEPGYCPPTILEFNGKRQLIIWHAESINGLDPETGNLYWSEPFDVRFALTAPMPRKFGNRLLVTSFYNGSKLIKLDGDKPEVIWQSKKISEKDTDTLHSIMSTPFVDGDYIYGVCSYGQLRCLKASTGERIWDTLQATTPDNKPARWANAFLVKNGDRFFLPNEKGDLIIAKLSPRGYEEISRTHLIEPTGSAAGRDILWSHPAFANRSIYLRNDKEIICVSLSNDER